MAASTPCLKAVFGQGVVFSQIIDSLGKLVNDVNFNCTRAGITLQAMDSSHVSLISLLLDKDGFKEYVCSQDVTIGVNVGNVQKILEQNEKEDRLTLLLPFPTSDALQFQFISPNGERSSHFSIKLMDIDSEHLGIPDTDYMATVKLPSALYKSKMAKLIKIGATVSFEVCQDSISFGIMGDVGNGVSVLKVTTQQKDENKCITIKLDKNPDIVNQTLVLKQSFALRYLICFSESEPLSKIMYLKMSPQVPLIVEFPIEGLGHIRYFLAPKIEDDEVKEEDEWKA